ncbi:uncharacterized protein YALI1_D09923g [Yarrowia lipolytica]|uniref:Uncharacterized protein n=1 Tax=Yarrowia lipolytica TaxID=4952 RepID=A0A1D8NDM4_YARLL|nr:hypothetical protein YALI1_D09923g [Yarrowia lipolytica]
MPNASVVRIAQLSTWWFIVQAQLSTYFFRRLSLAIAIAWLIKRASQRRRFSLGALGRMSIGFYFRRFNFTCITETQGEFVDGARPKKRLGEDYE